jgi:hypothetical protein
MAEALRARLDASEIVWDPDPDAQVRSPWRTYRHALRTTPGWATHRLIVQEDIEPCRNFLATVKLVAARRPQEIVSFFVAGSPTTGRLAVEEACKTGARYAEFPSGTWVPAIALLWPVRIILPFLTWVSMQQWPETFSADDEVIGRGLTALRETVWATVPSLVEHPDTEPSVVARRRHMAGADLDRVAACLIYDDLDPLSLDW